MMWNWQQPDWPNFRFDTAKLKIAEAQFLQASGLLLGAYRHIDASDKQRLTIQLLSHEAVKTSQIEGEWLNRDSVQSSLQWQFGLTEASPKTAISPAEAGIADVMVDLYQNFAAPLTEETLCRWHERLMAGSTQIQTPGAYRTHSEAMQVVSGPIGRRKVHFEAPPSSLMADEMRQFVAWFNATAATKKDSLPALTRAALAHLYFVSIHPFEDGNGRISRLLAEKALAQAVGEPTLIALSTVIEKERKDYYAALAANNQILEVDGWLDYFANTTLTAQAESQGLIDFIIAKTRFYDRYLEQLNQRQEKAVARLFAAGPDGFIGGLSAGNYLSITGTTRPTATRDLTELVNIGALTKTGSRKSTRYALNLDS